MLNVIALFLFLTFLTAYWLLPNGKLQPTTARSRPDTRYRTAATNPPLVMAKTGLSMNHEGNHFLMELRKDIERDLPPRPTDSVLKRHYDSLVAAELEDRLAKMPRY